MNLRSLASSIAYPFKWFLGGWLGPKIGSAIALIAFLSSAPNSPPNRSQQ